MTAARNVLIMVEDLFNIFEFWYPYYRLKEAGMNVIVVGPEKGRTYRGKSGTEITSDRDASSVNTDGYQGLVIPGGYAPDRMRRHPAMIDIVKKMDAEGKPIAAICHAGWMLASAQILKGRHMTSYMAIKDDVVNAGALWEDSPVVVDRNLVTSRTPDDLPVFMKAFLAAMESS